MAYVGAISAVGYVPLHLGSPDLALENTLLDHAPLMGELRDLLGVVISSEVGIVKSCHDVVLIDDQTGHNQVRIPG